MKSWDISQVQSINSRTKPMSACGSQINMFGQNIWPQNLSGKKNHNELGERLYSLHTDGPCPQVWEKPSQKREQSWSVFALGGWTGASGEKLYDDRCPHRRKTFTSTRAFQMNPGLVVNSGEVKVKGTWTRPGTPNLNIFRGQAHNEWEKELCLNIQE